MILRRIVAKTFGEALARVEREVGRDALIVESSTINGLATILARKPEPASATTTPKASSTNATLETLATRSVGETLDELRARGISDTLIEVLVRALRGLDPHVLSGNSPALRPLLRKVLKGLVRTDRSRPQHVALVGPTGVGKTTTIAKLAADAQLDQGEEVGIVTTDTYRVAAVEQLRAFAEMLDVPFHVAFTPQELRRALHELRGRDRIFVDTSGRSPRDADALRQIRAFVRAAPIDVRLCLLSGGRRRDLETALESFGAMNASSLIACKWDETEDPGDLVSLAVERDLPISHVTCGQRVPEDIWCADAGAIAQHLVVEAA